MSLSLVVDMNLLEEWASLLTQEGYPTTHWRNVGDPRALDPDIMAWALANGHAVLTHDLDFGDLLAQTQAVGPSVVLLRGRNVLPEMMGKVVVVALRQYEAELVRGALLVVDVGKARVRILPLR